MQCSLSSEELLSLTQECNYSQSLSVRKKKNDLWSSLIRLNESPLRNESPRKNNEQVSSNDSPGYTLIQCPSSICGSYNVVLCERDGFYVCTDCGVICESVPVYQELPPFFYQSVRADDTESSSTHGTSYSRLFHFNEILAAYNLSGPWIDNRDMSVIRQFVLRRISKTQRVPDKTRIQLIQRKIDRKFRVKRFSRRYGEKWIQILWRTCGLRPSTMSNETVHELRRIFRNLLATWPYVRHLIKGSRKNRNREQWPNFTVTLAEILRRVFPEEWEQARPWLPLLSEKKLKQLRPCFDYIFYLADLNKKEEIEDC